MIKNKTVLVLGAGASMDFGFPSGQRLVEIICDSSAASVRNRKEMLVKMGRGEKEILAFCEDLKVSGQPSVDAFLEHRPEFIEVGKSAMALVLLPLEAASTSNLHNVKKAHWYKYFFNQLQTGFDDFADNELSVLTFNYDRSFEYYLHTVMQKRYGKSPEECAEKLLQIPIIHLYGELGRLPWQKESDYVYTPIPRGGTVPYRGAISQEELFRRLFVCQTSIRIVHEDITQDKAFSKAHELLKNAQRIYFLGFGYHPTNVNRLQVRDLIEERTVLGTYQGLSTIKKKSTTRLFHDTPSKSIKLENCSCLDFFKEYGRLD